MAPNTQYAITPALPYRKLMNTVSIYFSIVTYKRKRRMNDFCLMLSSTLIKTLEICETMIHTFSLHIS